MAEFSSGIRIETSRVESDRIETRPDQTRRDETRAIGEHQASDISSADLRFRKCNCSFVLDDDVRILSHGFPSARHREKERDRGQEEDRKERKSRARSSPSVKK